MAYSLENLYAVLDGIVGVATGAAAAKSDAKTATEHAKAVRGAVRDLTAKAVSMGFLMSVGRKVIKALIVERIPDTPRKAVNVSEVFRILDAWEDPTALARQWAEGDFSAVSVAEALKAVKPGPDLLKAVEKAIKAALDGGEDISAVETLCERMLEAAVNAAEVQNAAPELEEAAA